MAAGFQQAEQQTWATKLCYQEAGPRGHAGNGHKPYCPPVSVFVIFPGIRCRGTMAGGEVTTVGKDAMHRVWPDRSTG